jgi:type 1 glutamine amidotransferase
MKKKFIFSAILVATLALPSFASAAAIKALIVDGQNNHKWAQTTPILVKYLKASGRFVVDVATSPSNGQDLSGFKPDFAKYDVVISNYNGDLWAEPTRKAFEDYVKNGGGFVSVHAANNSFRDWKGYNEMIGIGGWGGRSEKDGPYVRYWEGKIIRDLSPGRGGSHGNRHEFLVETRMPGHPIVKGLPAKWLHTQDELYDRLRGPAQNLNVLATAFADPSKRGSGHHEPMLMTIDYGKGRVFHTTLGHDTVSMNCVGFKTTFLRGSEWSATGKVTQKKPANFPTAKATSKVD